MATEKGPYEHSTAYAEQAARQTMDIVHGALATYFDWLRKMQSGSPWGNTPLNKALLKYTEENIGAAFAFAQRLSEAKGLQDVAKIQTEFMQTRLNAFNDQIKELGSAYTETAEAATKTPFPKPTD